MAQFTGNVIIKVDGNTIFTKAESGTINIGGFERTEVLADNKFQGFTQKPVAAMVSATLSHSQALDLIALGNKTDAVIRFECDSGSVFIMRKAFSTKPPELSAGEGDVEVEFKGDAAILG